LGPYIVNLDCLGVREAYFIIFGSTEPTEPNMLKSTVLIGLIPDRNTSLTGSFRADTDEVFDASDALLGVESVDDVNVVANKNLEDTRSVMISREYQGFGHG